jgi:hypothetical protein
MGQANRTDRAVAGGGVKSASMVASRRRLVYLLGLLILIGHLWDNAFASEHWPFSRYPMYSFMPKVERLTKFRFYAVTEQGEIPLNADQHFAPFTMARFDAALRTLARQPVDSPQMKEALGRLVEFYERGRRSGRHDDPPLESLRIYKVRWTLDPWARNVESPDKKTLILEVKTDVR